MESRNRDSLLRKKSLCVITGASRGIGKEIALRLSANVAPDSKFLLLARNEKNLLSTADEIRETNPSVALEIFPCDLSKFSESEVGLTFEKKVTSALAEHAPFEVAFIIHNAGTVGDISRPIAMVGDSTEIREYLDLNLVSCILLNNAFLRLIEKDVGQRVIVNITSLLAVKSLPGFGLYAIGKAAREAFMRSLTAEDKDLRILNYAPGPIKTDMVDYITKEVWNEETRQWFQHAQESGTLLSTEQTVAKLLKLLDDNTFVNGSHVDYYDFI